MGLTYLEGEVTGPTGRSTLVNFLVDSGTYYCLHPRPTWRAIGLVPGRFRAFELADGSAFRRRMSECRLRIAGEEGTVPVILGEDGDEALLGCIALENLLLILDPIQRRLQPVRPQPMRMRP
ncbi:MAG: aspartyl protease [Planctomycetes bacterium]|nr:aspartyl protease [Planctomycetota bacterium]